MPSAQKPAGAEDAERALSRDQPVAADAAAPTPANQGSASAAGAEFTDEDLQQDPLGNGDLLGQETVRLEAPINEALGHRRTVHAVELDQGQAGEACLQSVPLLPRWDGWQAAVAALETLVVRPD